MRWLPLALATLAAGAHGQLNNVPGRKPNLRQFAAHSARAEFMKQLIKQDLHIDKNDPPYLQRPMPRTVGPEDKLTVSLLPGGIGPIKEMMQELQQTPLSDEEVRQQLLAMDVPSQFFLRAQVMPDTAKVHVELQANVADEMISGDSPITFSVTKSSAVVDYGREGWSSDFSNDTGSAISTMAGIHTHYVSGMVSSSSFQWRRMSEAKSGDKGSQVEERQETTRYAECPPNSYCSVQTWSFLATLTARFFVSPVFTYRPGPGTDYGSRYRAGNYSMAALNPAWKQFEMCWELSSVYFDLEPRDDASSGTLDLDKAEHRGSAEAGGPPTLRIDGAGPPAGVIMPSAGIIRGNKMEMERNFTFVVRNPDGKPVRAVAVLNAPLLSDSAAHDPAPAQQGPPADLGRGTLARAKQWEQRADDGDICRLQDESAYAIVNGAAYIHLPGTESWSELGPAEDNMPEGWDEACPLLRQPQPAGNRRRAATSRRDLAPRGNSNVGVTILVDDLEGLARKLGRIPPP